MRPLGRVAQTIYRAMIGRPCRLKPRRLAFLDRLPLLGTCCLVERLRILECHWILVKIDATSFCSLAFGLARPRKSQESKKP